MARSGRFPRPVLRFRSGTSIYPFRGLSLGFKPLRGPRKVRIGFLYEHKLAEKARRLIGAILNGAKAYKGFEETFDAEAEVVGVEAKDYGDVERKLDSLSDIDVALVAIPDEFSVPEDLDYYVPLKQQAASIGLPTQMVTYSTLNVAPRNPYIVFNLALNLYGKAGGVAWGLAESLLTDAAIGIDVTGSYAVAAVLTDPHDPKIEWAYEFNPEVELASTLELLMYEAIRLAAESSGAPLESLVVHRDGRTHWSEVEAVRRAVSRAKAEGLVGEDAYYAVVEVRKRVATRLFKKRGERLLNPDKGVYLWLTKDTLLLTTTGAPERPLPSRSGLVKPLALSLADTSHWEKSLLDLARDVYWLAQLHWGSAFVTPRLPITTLYAHKIAHLLSLGAYPPPEYRGKLWFL